MSKNIEHNDNLPYSDRELSNYTVDQDFNIPNVPELSEEQLRDYQQIFKKSGWDKFKAFIKAENKWGRRAKVLKDFALTFIPYGRTISNTSEMATEILTDNKKDMSFSDRLKKVRNWISWNDKQGNFSFQELGKSLLKIAIPAGIVYGLQYLGVWEAVSNFL